MPLSEALALTPPQIEWALSSLEEVRKMEAGDEGKSDRKAQTMVLENVTKILTERTGRTSFSMEELADPNGTIERHERHEREARNGT
jgi:hypothetical protein